MPKKRFQPEEIIGKLRHANVLLGQGKKIAAVVKALGVTRHHTKTQGRNTGGYSAFDAKQDGVMVCCDWPRYSPVQSMSAAPHPCSRPPHVRPIAHLQVIPAAGTRAPSLVLGSERRS
jgi:hypothetical protein